MSLLTKIQDIEAEIARTQKNKATEGHIGLLKAKLAKLKSEALLGSKAGGGGGKGEGFEAARSGDVRCGLIGFPSVGKSTLLTKLTGTFSEAAAYEFTTLTCIPGTVNYRGARIQILDLPGIVEGAAKGIGRGRQVISTARTCDVILIVLDASKPMTHKRVIERELEAYGIRLNKQPPQVTIHRREKGGIVIRSTASQTRLSEETMKAILSEYKYINAEVSIRQPDITADELIDVIEGNRIYTPCIYVLNKIDSISIEELDLLDRVPHYVPISAKDMWNFDELLDRVWQYSGCIRIYTKPKGQLPDYTAPVILRSGEVTIEAFCNRIHRGLMKQFAYSWVWGSSCKHQPQRVGKEHHLNDEDVVQIVKKM